MRIYRVEHIDGCVWIDPASAHSHGISHLLCPAVADHYDHRPQFGFNGPPPQEDYRASGYGYVGIKHNRVCGVMAQQFDAWWEVRGCYGFGSFQDESGDEPFCGNREYHDYHNLSVRDLKAQYGWRVVVFEIDYRRVARGTRQITFDKDFAKVIGYTTNVEQFIGVTKDTADSITFDPIS